MFIWGTSGDNQDLENRLPLQTVKTWKFSTSDMTCLFSYPKYGRLQSITRSSHFVITLFIFGHSCHNRGCGQLTPTSTLKLFNCSFWWMNEFLITSEKITLKPDVPNAISDIPNTPFYIGEYVAILSLTCRDVIRN